MAKYEFAIKKEVLNSKETIFTPVCRKKSLLGNFTIFPWERIVKVYGDYVLMELEKAPVLTYEECEEHISGYQVKLLNMIRDKVSQVEFHMLEVAEC